MSVFVDAFWGQVQVDCVLGGGCILVEGRDMFSIPFHHDKLKKERFRKIPSFEGRQISTWKIYSALDVYMLMFPSLFGLTHKCDCKDPASTPSKVQVLWKRVVYQDLSRYPCQ